MASDFPTHMSCTQLTQATTCLVPRPRYVTASAMLEQVLAAEIKFLLYTQTHRIPTIQIVLNDHIKITVDNHV